MADSFSKNQFDAFFDQYLDLSPVMPEIAQIIDFSIQENFRIGGRYGSDNEFGGGSANWIPSKRAIRESGQTLVDTGRLRSSAQVRYSNDTITIGTNVVYGAIHHFGGKAGRNRSVAVPRRPWAVIQEEDIAEIKDAILHYYSGLA